MREVFDKITPNILEEIKNTKVTKLREPDFIVKQENQKKIFRSKIFAFAAAVFFLFIIVGGGKWIDYNTPVSLIAIDVNPSVEISVNKKEKVLKVEALNKDAEKILGEMQFKNVDLNIAVNAIIGSMVQNGYLKENTILVSVLYGENGTSEEVKNKIKKDINTTLEQNQIGALIMNQELEAKVQSTLMKEAESHHISIGKMMLISQIIKEDGSLSVENLSNMSLESIVQTADEKKIDIYNFVECNCNSLLKQKTENIGQHSHNNVYQQTETNQKTEAAGCGTKHHHKE